MKTLYLMRHGQTLFNQLGKIQGACDSPLTQLGITQAQQAKAYFRMNQIVFDEVYASTQERAVDTAKIVAECEEVISKKGLKEWNFGIFEGESERLNPKHQPGETSYGNFFVPYGGEGADDVQLRMYNTIKQMMESTPGDTILAVSHGGAMYRFIQKIVPEEIVSTLKFSNCCILVFEFEEETVTFREIIHPTTLVS